MEHRRLIALFRRNVDDAQALAQAADVEICVDTQSIRKTSLMHLKTLFDLSVAMSKLVELTSKQRNDWAKNAAYIFQTMTTAMKDIDEREMDADLIELERLINEVKAKSQDGSAEEKVCSGEPAKNPA